MLFQSFFDTCTLSLCCALQISDFPQIPKLCQNETALHLSVKASTDFCRYSNDNRTHIQNHYTIPTLFYSNQQLWYHYQFFHSTFRDANNTLQNLDFHPRYFQNIVLLLHNYRHYTVFFFGNIVCLLRTPGMFA